MSGGTLARDTNLADDPTLPFLKWAGGKRWLAPRIAARVKGLTGTYYEPFLGGGAVFFHARPRRAVMSDVNTELISVYRQIRDDVEAVIERLARLRIGRSEYDRLRSSEPRTAATRAVRFIYLNRAAFNGMYRVNRRGEFNVPFGCKPATVLCDRGLLRAASRALKGVKLAARDFEPQIDLAGAGDVVYCDPPYTVMHDNNGFRRYNESIFSWADQVRLAAAARRAADRGALVIVSNAHHREVERLYEGFVHSTVSRPSLISGKISGRGTVAESLFVSTSPNHSR